MDLAGKRGHHFQVTITLGWFKTLYDNSIVDNFRKYILNILKIPFLTDLVLDIN